MKKKRIYTKLVTIYFSEEEYLMLKRLSKENHKSMSELIREAVRKVYKIGN